MNKYIELNKKAGKSLDEITPIDVYSYKELLEMLERETPPKKCKTNIQKIDSIIGGFEPERLYILSAMTKAGKTTMAQTFMYNLAKQGDPSLMFTYEMSWKEVVKVYKSMEDHDQTQVDLPLFLPMEHHRGGGELQFQWLYDAIAKAKKEKGIKLVVIDHLHFLLPLKDFNNTSFLLGGIVREIKRMAVSLQIPIILIAHTQKIQDDKVPDWTMIRDSSFITQEADVVFMMYRLKSKEAAKKQTDDSDIDVYTNKTMFSVELNRMGGTTGKVKLIHNGAYFEECTDEMQFADDVVKCLK